MKNHSKKDFNDIYNYLIEYYEDEEYTAPNSPDPVHISAKIDDNKNTFTLEVEHLDVRTVVNGEYGNNGVISHDAKNQDIIEILNVLLALGEVDDVTTY